MKGAWLLTVLSSEAYVPSPFFSLLQTHEFVSHESFFSLSGDQTTSQARYKLIYIHWLPLTNKLCFSLKKVELIFQK